MTQAQGIDVTIYKPAYQRLPAGTPDPILMSRLQFGPIYAGIALMGLNIVLNSHPEILPGVHFLPRLAFLCVVISVMIHQSPLTIERIEKHQ